MNDRRGNRELEAIASAEQDWIAKTGMYGELLTPTLQKTPQKRRRSNPMKSIQRVLNETGSMNGQAMGNTQCGTQRLGSRKPLVTTGLKGQTGRARGRDGHSLPGWVKRSDITESTLLLVPLAGTHAPTGQTQLSPCCRGELVQATPTPPYLSLHSAVDGR